MLKRHFHVDAKVMIGTEFICNIPNEYTIKGGQTQKKAIWEELTRRKWQIVATEVCHSQPRRIHYLQPSLKALQDGLGKKIFIF